MRRRVRLIEGPSLVSLSNITLLPSAEEKKAEINLKKFKVNPRSFDQGRVKTHYPWMKYVDNRKWKVKYFGVEEKLFFTSQITWTIV